MKNGLDGLNRLCIAAALAVGSSMAWSSPVPPPVEPLLAEFFEAMNGQSWHRNDDWLNDDVPFCEWYGITCRFGPMGDPSIRSIDLSGNNLSGDIAEFDLEGLAARIDDVLDLSENRIHGSLDILPAITAFDLSGNLIEGMLPEIIPESTPDRLRRLSLARNQFQGEVPATWGALQLTRLDLSDNRLDAGHLHAFDAMSRSDWGWLRLTGNRFSGELASEVTDAKLYPRGLSNTGAGLNICFNDFVVNDPDVAEWVAEHHVADADFEQCIGRERVPVTSSISGSWFHPDRAGEGAVLQLLDNGLPLLYLFTFDSIGRQQWLFEVGLGMEAAQLWPDLFETRGRFSEGLKFDGEHPFVRSTANLRLDRVGENLIHVERQYHDRVLCGPWEHAGGPPGPGLCPVTLISDRMDYMQLTSLAGTSCEVRSEFQSWSGAWYDPARAGEGFLVEVLPDDRAVVYWFTYRPDGTDEQAWMMGQDVVRAPDVVLVPPPPNPVEAVMEIERVVQPVNGVYGPDFDPSEIELVEWGSLKIEFLADGTASVAWDSLLDEYGAGSHSLERLARPMLAECDD